MLSWNPPEDSFKTHCQPLRHTPTPVSHSGRQNHPAPPRRLHRASHKTKIPHTLQMTVASYPLAHWPGPSLSTTPPKYSKHTPTSRGEIPNRLPRHTKPPGRDTAGAAATEQEDRLTSEGGKRCANEYAGVTAQEHPIDSVEPPPHRDAPFCAHASNHGGRGKFGEPPRPVPETPSSLRHRNRCRAG